MQKNIVTALKTAIGSCAAIYIAMVLDLEFATSAGIITLLTIVTTRWGTIKLSLLRIVTFIMSVVAAFIIFRHIKSIWLAYGIFIFFLIFTGEYVGFRATLSVNALIGTHFLTTRNFNFSFILNEFLLVLIGTFIAFLLNLFQNNKSAKNKIVYNIHYTEQCLKDILYELSAYLFRLSMGAHVWQNIIELEKKLEHFRDEAYDYKENTFVSHTSYYIQYFEMRTKQCNVLHNLHQELKTIRHLPKQAQIVGEYISYLAGYVTEMNDPKPQLDRLNMILSSMEKENLPETREEFESRAKLYHVLMDLEEFLIFKRWFVESVDEKQQEVYW